MNAIDAEDIAVQAAWSRQTFGPGRRTLGVVNHIAKELDEIVRSAGRGTDGELEEWIDVMILAADGASRAGFSPAEIIGAYLSKTRVNMKRTWPDWRQFSEDQPIEHVR